MKIGKYVVGSVTPHETPRLIVVNGEEMMANVAMIRAELVPAGGEHMHGTISLQYFSTSDKTDALEKLVPGKTFVVSMDEDVPTEAPVAG